MQSGMSTGRSLRLPFRRRAKRWPTRRVTGMTPTLCSIAALATLTVLGFPATAGSSPRTSAPDLSGVTITFGDQVKEFQTLVAATNALQGAPYSVSWSNFLGGPPVITAETGGSVDLGDMAETPTIFAEAAHDPVKVVAAAVGEPGTPSPYGIMVPAGSQIHRVSQLRGKTVAVDEGTVEQYVLVKALERAGVPYSAVHVENLSITAGVAALENGKVDALSTSYPFVALIEEAHKGRVLTTGAGITKYLGYLTASDTALRNPQKAAAISDFINRLFKAQLTLQQNPEKAAQTYAKTYGLPLSVAEASVRTAKVSVTPITPAIIQYQQQESNAFYKLGLIPEKLNASKIFDLPYNTKLMATLRTNG